MVDQVRSKAASVGGLFHLISSWWFRRRHGPPLDRMRYSREWLNPHRHLIFFSFDPVTAKTGRGLQLGRLPITTTLLPASKAD
jgi:hypothetical protein